MPQPSEDNAQADRRRQARRAALYLAGLVAAVLVGFLVHKALQLWTRPARDPSRNAAVVPGPSTQPRWNHGGPADLFGSPLAAVGLKDLSGDPGQIPPPEGAKRLYGYQRTVTEQAEQQGRYEYFGQLDEAAGHYCRAMKEAGYELLKDATAPTGRRALVFMKGRGHATVALRKARQQAKMVTIVLTVVAPPASDGQEKR